MNPYCTSITQSRYALRCGKCRTALFCVLFCCILTSFVVRSDNNIVKTLCNFHGPEVLEVGSGMRRKRKVDGKREPNQTEVPCPVQNKVYSETFHLIDKGNQNEASYDMGGHSKGHNWSPKLTLRFFNINMNNGTSVYENLLAEHSSDCRPLKMPEQVKELAHTLMQRGPPMRTKNPEHPSFTRDISQPFDFGTGRKQRSDAKWRRAPTTIRAGRKVTQIQTLRKRQKRATWRHHQSKAHSSRERCVWKDCPGIKCSKAVIPRSYDTSMRCEECTAFSGKSIFLCNDNKKGVAVHCHEVYHSRYHNKHQ